MALTKNVNGLEIALTENEIQEIENQKLISQSLEFENCLNILRQNRNNLLSKTDYLALSDNTMSEAMTTYRQALRDLTNGLTTVEQINLVEFPTKPEIVN